MRLEASCPTAWSECVELSHWCTFRHPDRRLPGFLDPDPGLTQQFALKHKRWSRASETFLISVCDIEPKEQRKYVGRASETSFQFKHMVERILQWWNILRNRSADFGPCLSSRLNSLSMLIRRGNGQDSFVPTARVHDDEDGTAVGWSLSHR